jgi:hypothetical protein
MAASALVTLTTSMESRVSHAALKSPRLPLGAELDRSHADIGQRQGGFRVLYLGLAVAELAAGALQLPGHSHLGGIQFDVLPAESERLDSDETQHALWASQLDRGGLVWIRKSS